MEIWKRKERKPEKRIKRGREKDRLMMNKSERERQREREREREREGKRKTKRGRRRRGRRKTVGSKKMDAMIAAASLTSERFYSLRVYIQLQLGALGSFRHGSVLST